MSEILHRTHYVDSFAVSDERVVSGLAVPFDEENLIRTFTGSFTEVVRPGAFSRTVQERGHKVKFLWSHRTERMPIGRAVHLEERDDGLYAEFRVSQTPSGDEVLELIRDGTVDGLSMGFSIVREKWSKDRKFRELLEVKLHEISATAFPAYQGAKVLAVRADGSLPPLTQAQAKLRILELGG